MEILANGPKMRKEQSRMSASFLRLLGLDLKGLQKAIEDALAQSREAGQERARAAAMVLQGRSERPRGHGEESDQEPGCRGRPKAAVATL